MSVDVHHSSSSSMSLSVNMNKSGNQQQQQQEPSWSQHRRQQQHHYSSAFENEEVDQVEDDDRHGAQLHQPLYPASEWDQKLDRMLDELQLSISPQRKPAVTRVESIKGHDARQASSRSTVGSSGTSQEHHGTASSSHLFDASFNAPNPSVDNDAMAFIRDARSQSPEQLKSLQTTGPSYNVNLCEGGINQALSTDGSISSVRSHSSQQRQYSEYHSTKKNASGGSRLLVAMPSAASATSATSADDERDDDDCQATLSSSVSERTKRAEAWNSRAGAYAFASETTTQNHESGRSTDGQRTEKMVKTTATIQTSSNGHRSGYGPDEIDSALSDLLRVSRMAATRSTQSERENHHEPAAAESSRTDPSDRHQLTRSSSTSCRPAVMQSSTMESSAFRSGSSSSASSSRQQQLERDSSNLKTSESNDVPVHYATPENRLKCSTSISASSLSSTVHHAHVIDYSRMSQKQMRAAGIQSLSHHQLNHPICNFPDHQDFPLYNLRIIPESAGLLCNVAKHPHPMCNVERHPNFPLYAACPPCPAGGQQTQPVCNIKVHPALVCNDAPHPDYPAFAGGRHSTDKESSVSCNAPSHFDDESRLNHRRDRSPLPSKCNIPGHPEYPDYMSLSEPQTEPFCDVAGHPFGLCNIQTHPHYPDMMGPEDREAAPYCFIPSHPELLCNIGNMCIDRSTKNAHHPDYPGYMTEAEMPSEPICNVPRHPNAKRNAPMAAHQDPVCTAYAIPTTIKPKMYQPGVGGSPLPTIRRPAIDAGLQSPPKKLDDLMDTFNGAPYQPYTSTPLAATDRTPFATLANGTDANASRPAVQPLLAVTPKKPVTNGASAPPVYYPPETNETVAKTSAEVPLLMEQSHSMTMARAGKGQMKYSAKSSAGGSESDTKFKAGAGGAAVIPICLPVCCAMPCVIM